MTAPPRAPRLSDAAVLAILDLGMSFSEPTISDYDRLSLAQDVQTLRALRPRIEAWLAWSMTGDNMPPDRPVSELCYLNGFLRDLLAELGGGDRP